MKASQVMTRPVITVAPDTPVKEVAKLMVDQWAAPSASDFSDTSSLRQRGNGQPALQAAAQRLQHTHREQFGAPAVDRCEKLEPA